MQSIESRCPPRSKQRHRRIIYALATQPLKLLIRPTMLQLTTAMNHLSTLHRSANVCLKLPLSLQNQRDPKHVSLSTRWCLSTSRVMQADRISGHYIRYVQYDAHFVTFERRSNQSFSSIVGPNGSGKSNTIDALLFVFRYRASKMRQGKLSELIHNSAMYPDLDECSIEVHFREILDD